MSNNPIFCIVLCDIGCGQKDSLSGFEGLQVHFSNCYDQGCNKTLVQRFTGNYELVLINFF